MIIATRMLVLSIIRWDEEHNPVGIVNILSVLRMQCEPQGDNICIMISKLQGIDDDFMRSLLSWAQFYGCSWYSVFSFPYQTLRVARWYTIASLVLTCLAFSARWGDLYASRLPTLALCSSSEGIVSLAAMNNRIMQHRTDGTHFSLCINCSGFGENQH